MRVLYIIPSFKNSGPINVCFNIIKFLPKKFEVDVLSFMDGDRKNEFDEISNTIVISKYDFFSIVKFVKKGNYDIIHSHCLIPDLYNAIFPHSYANKISTIHNYLDVDYAYSKGKLIGGLMGLVNRLSFSFIDKNIACSESVKDFCIEFYNIKNISYISNGVDSLSGDSWRDENLSDDRDDGVDKFYYVGVLNSRKNVSQILKVFTLWSINKKAVLNIIGEGTEFLKLKNEYSNEKIIFHGVIEKPSFLVRRMDCFISASKAEGLPLAMLEALAAGNTFICSNIMPHIEIYSSSHESCGFIYDSTDSGLRLALDAYYYHPNKRNLKDNARKVYESKYTAEIMSQSYASTYIEK
ncbi:glycosyltransferase family 4 protein [Escherichia coli]|nr:glycosyltransferase family 4 protein [Escherichia coli]